jgi:hypothetical protein
MNWVDIFTAISSAVTAIGVFLAWWQIRSAKQLNKTQFEYSLAREYRELIQRIPVKALLGEGLTEKEYQESLRYLYHYINLTNDQIFLRQQGRINSDTWVNWRDGIKAITSLPAFAKAWKEIKSKPTIKFDELRRLEESSFVDDPKDWNEEQSALVTNAV